MANELCDPWDEMDTEDNSEGVGAVSACFEVGSGYMEHPVVHQVSDCASEQADFEINF